MVIKNKEDGNDLHPHKTTADYNLELVYLDL
jgi:hypothetical protein